MMNSTQMMSHDTEILFTGEALHFLTAKQARYYRIIPIKVANEQLHVACERIPNLQQRVELSFLTEHPIKCVLYSASQIDAALERAYGSGEIVERKWRSVREYGSSKIDSHPEKDDVVAYVDWLLATAIEAGASDIHVEVDENAFRIRLRLDGKLVGFDNPECRPQSLISRLKIMSGLDIAEKRRPQDGRIRFETGTRPVDIRLSTLPTDFGEKVVMRILDKSALNLSLDSLQMESNMRADFQRVLKMPHGMILVTGPTGSGKTTTLYAALNYLNNTEANIITIEDPIEYNLPGVNQTMVRADIGLTFASVLRSVLRQDPNIIMLGEIRDAETAEIAVRSALTGHLVLSTLHTNDAAGTIVRLIDMGIEPFLVAGAVRMILAQRLVRRICPDCKQHYTEERSNIQAADQHIIPTDHPLFYGNGCDSCYGTGYRGRIAIFEPLIMTDTLAKLILSGCGLSDLRAALHKQSGISLRQSALRHVAKGITTLDEVLTETL
ncbi:MAG: GspE/PulE family protein [Calditrichota bacterium]